MRPVPAKGSARLQGAAQAGGDGAPHPRREDLVTSEVLAEAYVRLHRWGPEFGGENGLSNHGPMAVEVLSRRGYDDQVGSWLDRYVAWLETLPGEDEPITRTTGPKRWGSAAAWATGSRSSGGPCARRRGRRC